jgi:hypothetical protein
MIELKYSEVLKLNKELGNKLESRHYSITVLSNIIVQQSKEILEYKLRCEDINANIDFGDMFTTALNDAAVKTFEHPDYVRESIISLEKVSD